MWSLPSRYAAPPRRSGYFVIGKGAAWLSFPLNKTEGLTISYRDR
jgi:hypothetical protein